MPDANARTKYRKICLIGYKYPNRLRQPTGLQPPDRFSAAFDLIPMQKSQEDIDAELNDDMAAFNRDPETWSFREYWQTHDQRFIGLTVLVENVCNGKTIVSDAVIGQCKEAVLQINQITHVLTELSKDVGQTSLVGAMNIAYTYDVRAITARSQLQTILAWQTDLPPQSHSLR